MCNVTKKKKFSNFFRRVGEKTRRAGGADTPPVPPAAAAAGEITAEAPRRFSQWGASPYANGELLLCQVLTDIDGHSHDNDKALDDIGVRGVDVHKLQSDLHQLKDQNADQNAGHGADTAGGGNAADGRSRNGIQLIALCSVDGCAAGLCSSRQPARPNMQEARM